MLSKNNIGSDHEEFEECADHLYRTVTFAMVNYLVACRHAVYVAYVCMGGCF